MSRVPVAVLLGLVLLLSIVAPVGATEPGPATLGADAAPPASGAPSVVPGEVIVRARGGAKAAEIARGRGFSVLAEVGPTGAADTAVLSTGGRAVDAVITELRADPRVHYAEPSYRVDLAAGPTPVTVNDPITSGQYSLNQMRVREAWSVETGGTNVIAVLDTGVQFSHRDLSGRLLPGRDFVNDDADASDDNGHGTWVTGIIVARANDGYGIAGISWSDKVLPVKIMNREGTGSTSALIEGIRWAADQGADVINMSVGGFPYSQAVQDAVDYAWSKGAVLVGAAGNNNREETFYPASLANVVSVSATQVDGEFSHWSSYGPKVDVSAPGSSVLTTNCTTCTYAGHDTWGDHTYISGTSFATPNVAGVVALLRAAHPTDTPQQIVNRLLAGVDDLGYPGWDNRYGLGRVNALRSLTGSGGVAGTTSGDAMEPNNTVAAARAVATGTTIRPTIHPAGDVDTFAVDAPRMGRLEVRVTGVPDTRAYPWNRSAIPIDPIVELLTTSGTVLTRVNAVGAGGTELATYAASGPTRVVVRIRNAYANGNVATYSVATRFVDEVPPRVLGLRPAPGATMVLPTTNVTFRFSEPVTGVDGASVVLRNASGTVVPSAVAYDTASGTVTVNPTGLLASNSVYRLSVASTIRDSAGLALAGSTYAFTTMPGQAWVPGRRVTFAAGSQAGHRVSGSGGILELRTTTLRAASGASAVQRATLPNLPGDWLHVENGTFAGTWVRESARAAVAGTTELTALPSTTRIHLAAGTHTGRRYDAAGAVTATRAATLVRTSGANVDAVAVINGARAYRVVNGTWAGYWITESAAAHRDGFVDRMAFSPVRRVLIAAGTSTAAAYDSAGNRTSSKTATLARPSGARVGSWAIIDGRPHVLVVDGLWAGLWLPEERVLGYAS